MQDLDFLFGLLQRRLAYASQLHAALELLERFIERQIAGFELVDDGLELGERTFEVGRARTASAGLSVDRFGRAEFLTGHDERTCFEAVGWASGGKLAARTVTGQSHQTAPRVDASDDRRVSSVDLGTSRD